MDWSPQFLLDFFYLISSLIPHLIPHLLFSFKMDRQAVIQQSIALRAMETHAALTARAITTQVEVKATRDNYDHYQGHYKVYFQK